MALSLGELNAIIAADDRGFASTLDAAGRTLTDLQGETSQAMADVERSVSQAMAAVARDLDAGFDADAALADIDRLVAEFARELDEMDDIADRAGRQAGERLTDGLRRGADDAGAAARDAGEAAGGQFGDGVDTGGRGRMSGVASGLMGALKAAPWLAAGAAVGAVLMDGIASAMDAQKARQKLYAQIGATEQEMAKLGRVAGEVYSAGYGEGLEDVTEALRGVIQNIDGMRDASEESLAEISKRAMDTATILDEDVGQVTRAVAKVLRTELVSSADEAFDIIVRGAQLGGNEAEDLLDTFSEYSTIFRSMGLSGEQAMGLIVQGLRAGARDADVVADAIKEFTIEAVAGGDRVKQGFESLGLDADRMVAKFAKGGPEAAKAFDLVLDKLREIEDPAERNAVAIELFGTKAEDLGNALYALDPSAAVEALGQVGGAAEKAGDTLHDTAANKLESFKRSIQTNLVDFFGGTVIPALEQFGEKLNFDALVEKIQPIVEKIKGFFEDVFSTIEEWVAENQGTIEEWTTTIESGMDSVGSVIESAIDIITAAWDLFGEDILNTLKTLVDTFLGIWNGLWQTVEGAFETFAGLFTGDWERLREGLEKIWDGLWETVGSILSGALELIKQQISRGWEAAQKLTGDAWDRLVKAVSDGIDNAIKFVKELPDRILKALGDLSTLLLQAGRDVINGLIRGIKEKIGDVINTIRDVGNRIKENAESILGIGSPSKIFAEYGEWVMQGFEQGFVSQASSSLVSMDKIMEQVKTQALKRSLELSGILDNVQQQVAKLTGQLPKPKPEGVLIQGVGPLETSVGIPAEEWKNLPGWSENALPGGVIPSSPQITVNMPDAVIREEADVYRIAREFSFALAAR